MAIRLLFIILTGCGKSSLLSLLFDERETWMLPKVNCSTCPVPGQEFWWWAWGSGYQDSGRISGVNDTHITNWSAYPGNIKD